MMICEIKHLRKFKFYIDSNSKTSTFAKLSTCKNCSNFQLAKLNPSEIRVGQYVKLPAIDITSNDNGLLFINHFFATLSTHHFKSHWTTEVD